MSTPAHGQPSCPQQPTDGWRLSHSQNFITDKHIIPALLNMVNIEHSDTIIEIGPGRGALTRALAGMASHVISIEADTQLAIRLIQQFDACPQITLVHGNFLEYPLPARPFVVVANIPFNRTAEIIRKLTGDTSGMLAAYLIMQKEAAAKFSGRPTANSHLFSHLLRLTYSIDYLCDIPRGCFSPKPGVDAAFVRFRKLDAPLLDPEACHRFKDLLCYLFAHARPSVLSTLGLVFSPRQLAQLSQPLQNRGRERLNALTFTDWLAVFQAFSKHGSPRAYVKIKGAYATLLEQQATLVKRHRTSSN